MSVFKTSLYSVTEIAVNGKGRQLSTYSFAFSFSFFFFLVSFSIFYKGSWEVSEALSGRTPAARASECSRARRRSSATLVVLCSWAAKRLGPAVVRGVQHAHRGRQPFKAGCDGSWWKNWRGAMKFSKHDLYTFPSRKEKNGLEAWLALFRSLNMDWIIGGNVADPVPVDAVSDLSPKSCW